MKVVKVEVLPARDGEVVTAVITEETKKGGRWEETRKNIVETGTPEAVRSILLDEDDRVVIEGRVDAEVVTDRDQMGAKKVYRGEKAEEQKKKDEEQSQRFEKLEREEKQRLEREKPEEFRLREEQAKARDEKVMGKQPSERQMAGLAGAGKREGEDEVKAEPQEPPRAGPPGALPTPRDAGLRTEVPADSHTVKGRK